MPTAEITAAPLVRISERTAIFVSLAASAWFATLSGTVQREKAEIGVRLTLTPPKKTMTAEAAAAGQHEEPGFHPVPKIRIVTIEGALTLRDRAVEFPARRDEAFRKAAEEQDSKAQGKLDL